MCCDGSSDERRWIFCIRAVKSGDDGSDGRFVAECSGGDDIFILLSSQLLYSTYLLSSARRTIGVDEGMSWEVHERLMPAFEELFDEVEEHALNILLEPWTLLVNQDTESFQKVTPALLLHLQGDFLADAGQLRKATVDRSTCTSYDTWTICLNSLSWRIHLWCVCMWRCVCGRMCVLLTVRSTRNFKVCTRIHNYSWVRSASSHESPDF